MPLWLSAMHGTTGCVSRPSVFCRPPSSAISDNAITGCRTSVLQRRRVAHSGVRSAQLENGLKQTWNQTFQPCGGRWSKWRVMEEEQEPCDPAEKQDGTISNADTEFVNAGAPAVVATGSVFGAVALITGTSVGAGILALPAITAPIGFIPSATLLGMSWAFLVLEALLLAEVNVELMRRRDPKEVQHSQVLSLRSMAEETLGAEGAWLTTAIYLLLSYTLLVAYISKSGEVLSLLLDVPHRAAADFVFTFGFGGLLCAGGAKMADSVNQVLTVMLLGLFLLIMFGGATMADWTGLEHVDWTQAPQTLPIIFLALVYHDLTPVVCAQLGGDIGRIRISIILGSLVPLVMFLSWDAVALCITPLLGGKDPIDVFIRVGGPGPAFIVESFAILAVATSFIGTVLGLQEFLLEQWGEAQGSTWKMLSIHRQAPPPLFEWWNRNGPRAITSVLVLAPPLVASSLVSDAFFSASDLAGAYGMTSLYGVIPPMMAWGLQKHSLLEAKTEKKAEQRSMSVLGDRITLATVGAFAMAVIVGQVMIDLPHFSSSAPVVTATFDRDDVTPASSVISQPFSTLAAP